MKRILQITILICVAGMLTGCATQRYEATRTFHLEHVKRSEAIPILASCFGDDGDISAGSDEMSVVVRTSKDKMREVELVMEQLDCKPTSMHGEFRFVGEETVESAASADTKLVLAVGVPVEPTASDELRVHLIDWRNSFSNLVYFVGNKHNKSKVSNSNYEPLFYFEIKDEELKTVQTSTKLFGIDEHGYVGPNSIALNRRYSAYRLKTKRQRIEKTYNKASLLKGLPAGKYTVIFKLKILLDGPDGDSETLSSLRIPLVKK